MRVEWQLPQPLLPGRFVRRANRFAAEVVIEDRVRYVHLPNSGRLLELLQAGALVRVHPTGYGRTWGTLLLVRHGGRWVSVDSHLPNRLWEAALRAGGLPPVGAARSLGTPRVPHTIPRSWGDPVRDPGIAWRPRWEREIPLGNERIDFRVETADGVWFVETKSCTRVEEGVALFPDAPTARGARQLRQLAQAAQSGMRAAVIWFIQREDAHRLRLDAHADPELAQAGREAVDAGVILCAYLCSITPRRIAITQAVPVEVPPRHLLNLKPGVRRQPRSSF